MIEFWRAGLSKIDVVKNNIFGINKTALFISIKKIKQMDILGRIKVTGKKNWEKYQEIIVEIIKSDNFEQ